MTARKDRKRALREERLARERAAAKARRRRRAFTAVSGTIVGLAAVVGLVLVMVHSASQTAALPGIQATDPPWAPSYDGLSQRITDLGFPPNGNESFHIHALLHVFVKGSPVAAPANIGITSGVESPLHTHDTSGVIHIEAGEPHTFTLADFFAVWGVKLSATQLGGLTNHGSDTVQVYVNGQQATDGPATALEAKANIVVAYGAPGSFPTTPPADALARL